MEGILDRRSERIFTDRPQSTVLAAPAGLITRKRAGFHEAATGVSEVRRVLEVCGRMTPRANPRLPTKADPAS